jgi:hypothetical protein
LVSLIWLALAFLGYTFFTAEAEFAVIVHGAVSYAPYVDVFVMEFLGAYVLPFGHSVAWVRFRQVCCLLTPFFDELLLVLS